MLALIQTNVEIWQQKTGVHQTRYLFDHLTHTLYVQYILGYKSTKNWRFCRVVGSMLYPQVWPTNTTVRLSTPKTYRRQLHRDTRVTGLDRIVGYRKNNPSRHRGPGQIPQQTSLSGVCWAVGAGKQARFGNDEMFPWLTASVRRLKQYSSEIGRSIPSLDVKV
jgi:hypothetical protein